MGEAIDELKDKRLCCRCVREDFLSGVVVRTGEVDTCSYCLALDRTLSVGDIAEMVDVAFEQHFVRTSTEPDSFQIAMQSDDESSYDWTREGDPVIDAIGNAARIPQAAAEDIQEILADEHGSYDPSDYSYEEPFGGESYYEEKRANADAWAAEWEAFERSLKTEARFFNQDAASHLAAVFEGLTELKTSNGRPLIVAAGPGHGIESLFRARVFQAEAPLLGALKAPDVELGPPPARFAAAGRMNPAGISVFYGASDAETAVAEVRPPVGSWVAVAQFEIIRPLRLLDLTALEAAVLEGSVFDPSYGRQLERIMFLRTLSARITRAVMPDDTALEYLSTQAIADFLGTDPAGIDGIVFPSVQAAGAVVNAVLFHKASRVEPVALPAGAKLSARSGNEYEEGFEIDYQVAVETPWAEPAASSPTAGDPIDPSVFNGMGIGPQVDARAPSLRIRLDSVQVHDVQRVKFDTRPHRVRRSTHKPWRGNPAGEPF